MSCTLTPSSSPAVKRARPLLGTVIRVRARGAGDAAVTRAFECAQGLEAVFSKFQPGSELNLFRLQPEAPRSAVFREALQLARELEAESDGAFRPEDEAGRLDLSGIAKGYIADRMADILSQTGAAGEINAGGDIRFFGPPPYEAHIRFQEAGFRRIESPFAAIATSSPSEAAGNPDSSTRYPLSLRPGLTRGHTVSALASSCALADAFTKIALFGTREAIDHCVRLHNTQVLVFDPHGHVQETYG